MKPTINCFLPKLLFTMMVLVFSGTNPNCGLRAQALLGFGSPGLVGWSDTAYSSTNTIPVAAYIKNIAAPSMLAFHSSIQIHGYIDTGNAVIPFVFPQVDSINILPGDSIFFLMPFVFLDNQMGGQLRIGNNVIVVWPISLDPNFSTQDSISANVFVIDPNGVPEHNKSDDIRFYPVPTNGPLYVTSSSHSLLVKEVIVRDAAGKTIAVSNSPSLGIDTEAWAHGIYFLEITFDNGQKSTYKIIR
ncbi:MAG: T9SS type A sorting domain-containing protein [Bacteroidetes bacterium]|nr:T9SS type A sorting domain-containing protein [Bacteroidota bacterium]